MTSASTPSPDTSGRLPWLRRGGLSVALWLFGLSTTLLLVGLWGRSVTTNEQTIESSARAVLESDAVADRVTGWIASGIEESAGGLPEGVATSVATSVWNREETRVVLATTVDRLVDAAMAPPGASVPVNTSELLRPLVPLVVGELEDHGVGFSEASVEAALEQAPTVILSTESDSGVASAVAEARAWLSRVVAVGLAGMLLGGATATALAEERVRQARGLAVRVLVSAMTFAILLRVGAWALDPQRGRSPLAAGGSVLLSSSLHVLVIAALTAAGVVIGLGVLVKRRRRSMAV